MSIATAELVAAHLRLLRHLVRIDVDQLHDPVAVGAAGRGEQVDQRRAADAHRLGQRPASVGQHVGAIGDDALVDRPARRRQASLSAKRTGRGTYGTGFAGSETYSSKPAAFGRGRR